MVGSADSSVGWGATLEGRPVTIFIILQDPELTLTEIRHIGHIVAESVTPGLSVKIRGNKNIVTDQTSGSRVSSVQSDLFNIRIYHPLTR